MSSVCFNYNWFWFVFFSDLQVVLFFLAVGFMADLDAVLGLYCVGEFGTRVQARRRLLQFWKGNSGRRQSGLHAATYYEDARTEGSLPEGKHTT